MRCRRTRPFATERAPGAAPAANMRASPSHAPTSAGTPRSRILLAVKVRHHTRVAEDATRQSAATAAPPVCVTQVSVVAIGFLNLCPLLTMSLL